MFRSQAFLVGVTELKLKTSQQHNPSHWRKYVFFFLITLAAIAFLACFYLELLQVLHKSKVASHPHKLSSSPKISDSIGQEKLLDSFKSLRYPFSGNLTDEDEGIHLSQLCGTWQSEYSRLHHEIVEENKRSGKGKLLIFSSCGRGHACGGIGDHLVGMSSVFLLAIVFKRAFFVEWPELESTEVFLPSSFDWRLKNVKPINTNIAKANKACSPSATSFDSYELDFYNFDNGKEESLLPECLLKLENVSTIRVHVNRGLAQWAVSQPRSSLIGNAMASAGLKSAFASGCLLRNLLKVNQMVEERVKGPLHELQHTNKLKVCIHSRQRRQTDADFIGSGLNVSELMDEIEVLLSCANTLYEYWGQESIGTLWFYMSSSLAARGKVKELYPDRVMESGLPVIHSDMHKDRELALEVTAAEWLLFTKCHFFVFHSSGMSRTAAAFAMRPLSMFSFGNFGWTKLKNQCDPTQSTTPVDMGSDWSGF